jgi:hypothetical protein
MRFDTTSMNSAKSSRQKTPLAFAAGISLDLASSLRKPWTVLRRGKSGQG